MLKFTEKINLNGFILNKYNNDADNALKAKH